MKLYFVRHGQTDTNVAAEKNLEITDNDAPLNQTGIAQVRETAQMIRPIKFDVIVSSPLQRAIQTADIINEQRNLPIVIKPDLRELDGGAIEPTRWAELFDMDKNIKPDNGESATELFERVYRVLDELRKTYTNEVILMVAHGGVHRAVRAYCNDLPRRGNMRIDRMRNAEVREYTL